MNALVVTFFHNFAATSKTEHQIPLADLAERIRVTTGPDKASLPWLKLARFGDVRTDKRSLRHDGNVLAITGIEANYDAETMGFDAAVELLEKQGITSIVYTSPSHTADAPRWRVLCPLSEAMPPDRRSPLLGRLNGLFRGVFARESWTLSQAYYFGSVRNNPSHGGELIDGTPIDQHHDLDEIWIGSPSGSTDKATPSGGCDEREDAELIRRIVTGEGLHTEMTALAARYIGRGVSALAVGKVLRGLMLSFPDPARDERWRARYQSIDAIVASGTKKYTPLADHRREIARLAGRMIHARRPAEEVRAAVKALAGSRGIDPMRAESIAAWVAQQELDRRRGRNA